RSTDCSGVAGRGRRCASWSGGGRRGGRRSCTRRSRAPSTRGEGRGAAALGDVGGGLEPRRAFAAGIALRRLLWVRCAADTAAKAADLVLGAGGFDLIALD